MSRTISYSSKSFSMDQSWLWQDLSARRAYGLAVLLGLAMALLVYPVSFLTGHGGFFETGDAAQHVAGWWFFKDDAWRFPVLVSERLNAPAGVSIAFSDSIPLAALLAKPFAAWLPNNFHYFGYWHGLSYVLQGVAAVFVMRALKLSHLPAVLFACVFALTWPTFTYRYGHTALMTQGLILLALGCYFRGHSGNWSISKTCVWCIGLCTCAFLIHPYLWALTYPFLLVFLLGRCIARKLSLIHAASWVAGSLILLSAVLYSGGYFIGQGAASGGYGFYSLNILGPFCGGLLCDIVDGSGGQSYEGISYFGAGLLLMLGWVILRYPRQLVDMLRRHWLLTLLLLCFTLYALSNRMFWGNTLVFEWKLAQSIEPLVGIFRASGRVFWPVGYVVMLSVLVILLRQKSVVLLLFMLGALALQWQDTRGFRQHVQAQASVPEGLDLNAWQAILHNRSKVQIYPGFGCRDAHYEGFIRYQFLAARSHMLVNSAYLARFTQSCQAVEAFLQAPSEPNALYAYVLYTSTPLYVPTLFKQAMSRGECALDGPHLLCAPNSTAQQWRQVANPIDAQGIRQRRWGARELPSIVGQFHDGWLVPRQVGAVGYLSYGPHIRLDEGEYRMSIDYRSDALSQRRVGHWDVIGVDSNGVVQTVAAGPLQGTINEPQRFSQTLQLTQHLDRIEVRVFSEGQDLAVGGFELALPTLTTP